MTKYTDVDYIAVKHYLLFDNKLDAYLFSRANITKSDNMQSLKNMCWSYFKQDRILKLIDTERERLIDNIPDLLNRLGMKKPESQKTPNSNKQSLEDLEKLAEIDKSKAILILESTINANPGDSKTIKELMPLLTKLKSWDKEKITDNSNVYRYELPNKH